MITKCVTLNIYLATRRVYSKIRYECQLSKAKARHLIKPADDIFGGICSTLTLRRTQANERQN